MYWYRLQIRWDYKKNEEKLWKYTDYINDYELK
jgi:hypothetical protein